MLYPFNYGPRAEETGLEPAHRLPDTGFQDRGDTNYSLLFLLILQYVKEHKKKPGLFKGPGLIFLEKDLSQDLLTTS